MESTMTMYRTVVIDRDDLEGSCQEILNAWREALVVRMRAPWLQPDEVRDFYDSLLPRIGTPYALAEDARVGDRSAQRTGETWMEVRFDPTLQDAYRHSLNAQPLHTDGSYIATFPNATLMCCVQNAAHGGETTIIAGEKLLEVLRKENPELLKDLERVQMLHERSGDRREYPVVRYEKDGVHLNWNYYCVSKDATPEAQELRERFFQFLQTSPGLREEILPVKLETGDAVAWKDELCLHGRNAFEATKPSTRFLWKCAVDVGVFN